jgi:hypothetical protein
MHLPYVIAIVAASAMLCAVSDAAPARRAIPKPLPGHPGNVFLRGENVTIALPESSAAWSIRDYDGKEIATTPAGEQTAELGKLPVGFYRAMREGADWVSFAVLEPLKAPTPLTSPIGSDVAMAWFYPDGPMDAVASLCTLAGLNWVRDRLAWGHMEPQRGRFEPPNRYDRSAQAQSAAGLKVLQVNHSSPEWAAPVWKRFPTDLRDAYRFYREMARRWQGKVDAFEPWNEADITVFGGHTGSEMAAMQKASYVGIKAGNPEAIGCLNVFAAHVRAQLDDLHDNEAWPYFDTYNLHHYEALAAYPKLYGDHRSVSAGRPLWVTECAMPLRWTGDPKLEELSENDLREQSERVAKVFCGSLHEGSAATFHFILGHYVEGPTQFGLIRRDLTPRPAYVALAAVGRLLADARPLGRLNGHEGVRGYLFRARPDGKAATVLVAWAEKGEAALTLPEAPLAAFDHLGRPIAPAAELNLRTAPTFVILPTGAVKALTLDAPPKTPRRLPGKPSPIVLQAIMPEETTVLHLSAHKIAADSNVAIPVVVYNFGSQTAQGTLKVEGPAGWQLAMPARVMVEPDGRVELMLTVNTAGQAERLTDTIRIRGDFGALGKPVLAFRVAPQGNAMARVPGVAVPNAASASAWQPMVSGNGVCTVEQAEQGIRVVAEPKSDDKWAYIALPLPEGAQVPEKSAGLACDIAFEQGSGIFRAVFVERSGSAYVADFVMQPTPGQKVKTVALLDAVIPGYGWSPPDPNGRLDLDQIVAVRIGCNTHGEALSFTVSDLRWVRRLN